MQNSEGPGNKRKGSALELAEGSDFTCKAARDSEEEEEEGLQVQETAEPEQPLTERNGMHLLTPNTSKEELLNKIDDITAAGIRVLDQMQANFLERMSRVKAEVSKLVGQAHETLQTQSGTTMELQRRALLAGQLIDKLNFKTQDPEQARPDTLFSAEDEGEAEHAAAQE